MMCLTDFIKRFLPFALTFAAGLFIASFFMPVGFSRSASCHRENHRNEFREMQIRLQDSEEENIRLRDEINSVKYRYPVPHQNIGVEPPLVPAPQSSRPPLPRE